MTEIVPYSSDHASALAEIVNAHLAQVQPDDLRIDAALFDRTMRNHATLWDMHWPEDPGNPSEHEPVVALSAGWPAGYAVLAHGATDGGERIASIVADPTSPDAADHLLAEAESRGRSLGRSFVESGGLFAFGFGWPGVPAAWDHIVAAHTRAGYEVTDRWIIMVGSTAAIPIEPPRPAGELPHIIFTGHHDRREWLLDLYDGETLIGECHAWGIPPHLEACPGASDWVTIDWVGIEEPYQRRGYAYWLMVKQMHYHLRAGRKRIMLWTGHGNVPARALYHRLRFVDGPETRVFRKTL